MAVHEQKAKAAFWDFMNQDRDLGIAAMGAVFLGLAVSHKLGNIWPLIAVLSLAAWARYRGEGLLSLIASLLTVPGVYIWWNAQAGLSIDTAPPFGSLTQIIVLSFGWIALVSAAQLNRMRQR